MARLNYKDITIAYLAGSVASAATGAVLAGLWAHYGGNADYPAMIGGAWLLVVGFPSCIVGADTVRERLGSKRKNVDIRSSRSVLGRTIKISHQGRDNTIFAQIIPSLIGIQPQSDAVLMPDTFEVVSDGILHTFTKPEIENFLYRVWRKQIGGGCGLSRGYWMRDNRPRWRRTRYDAMLALIMSVDGLVVDRGERRAGRLSLPPQLSMRAIEQGGV